MSSRLTNYPRGKVVTTFVVLLGANILIWSWAWLAFFDRPTLLATALLAYIFGLRHAFDPDHIAAIDNVVRKLLQDDRPAFLSGFFFALGHSSIVVIASVAISGTALTIQPYDLNEINLVRTAASALFCSRSGEAIFTYCEVSGTLSCARAGVNNRPKAISIHRLHRDRLRGCSSHCSDWFRDLGTCFQ
jgi:high-affinity nickel permease